MRLNGKSVVITGAGSGVGRASALLFAAEGANVVCADIVAERVDETVELVGKNGGTAVSCVCDVTNEQDVRAAIDAAIEASGRLDVMFNNAGVATPRPGLAFEDHTDDDWDRLMGINLRGVFYGMKQAVITFKAQGDGGVIVNTGSVAGMVGWGGTVYGATKGGVLQLTRGVAIEVAPHGIRVNAICPAGMPTTNFSANTSSEEVVNMVAASHPLGRIITPEDCAAAALFLASDEAANLTGVSLPVDGGYIAVSDPFDYSTLRTVTTGLRFPEGPIALDDGSVLVSEIEGGALNRVLPDGSQHPIDCGGGVNGAALGPDGAAYVGNDGGLGFKTEDGIRFPYTVAEGNEGGYVQRVDIDTGTVETVFTHVDDEHLGGLNDIVFDATGSCYIVDTGLGAVHYADPVAGTIRCLERGLSIPNGMGLSPDGTRLYLTETYVGNVVVWDVVGPGQLANKHVLFNDGGEHGWDGLAIDGAGNVCASNLKASGISVINPLGEEIARFKTPEYDSYVTNVCFGGPEGDTAYICSSGRGILYSVRWPWGGLRLHFAR